MADFQVVRDQGSITPGDFASLAGELYANNLRMREMAILITQLQNRNTELEAELASKPSNVVAGTFPEEVV